MNRLKRTCLGRLLKSSNHCYLKIERFYAYHVLIDKMENRTFSISNIKIIRFLGFTACGMPLCTKRNNFIWPLFLAIMDFSSGACSKFRFSYNGACSRMRGNTVPFNVWPLFLAIMLDYGLFIWSMLQISLFV